jgi:hypothetical protein
MKWINIKDELPECGIEVLVWINGHRNPAWRNNYALVAYFEGGKFWEERHPSKEPLIGIIKWAEIKIPE